MPSIKVQYTLGRASAEGGEYSQRSPFGFWLEDVRASGYLRPAWGLAFDALFEVSWQKYVRLGEEQFRMNHIGLSSLVWKLFERGAVE